MSKKYLISGVSPGPAGVGRVLEYLILNSNNFKFLFPPIGRKHSIKDINNLNVKGIFLFFIDFFQFFTKRFIFNLYINLLKNNEIVILHPQAIGYKNVKKLILRNKASIYIMDNSFFCIKSYNYLNSSERACLLCLNLSFENAKNNNCSSFPINYTFQDYFSFLAFLKENSKRISFITQNKGQTHLLRQQFGSDISYNEIGLLTSDMFGDNENEDLRTEKRYDVVFHGDETLAKGSKYILEIAKKLPELSFLFPFNSTLQEIPKNVDFIKMSWTSGLKEHVINSKITFCPSLWSAPIEGSVVKTLNLGVALGVFDSEYSFSQELPSDSVLILTGSLFKDVESLKEFVLLEKYKKVGIKGKIFINEKIQKMTINFENIFK